MQVPWTIPRIGEDAFLAKYTRYLIIIILVVAGLIWWVEKNQQTSGEGFPTSTFIDELEERRYSQCRHRRHGTLRRVSKTTVNEKNVVYERYVSYWISDQRTLKEELTNDRNTLRDKHQPVFDLGS